MMDFGDEIVIHTHGVPWLIWIQMIVLLLLFIIIYFATVFSSPDPPETEVSTSSSSSQMSKTVVVNPLTVSESQSVKGEIATNARRRIGRREAIPEREGSSIKETTPSISHPCHIIRLARLAFFKCLGLEPDQNSSSGEQLS